MRTRSPLAHLVALVVAVMLACSTVGTADAARRPDRLAAAKDKIEGHSLTNRHTHMRTWIVGYYPYHRMVRIKRHWRPKKFYGLRVSAQRCDSDHCWGRVVKGKLWSPHQPGRPLPQGQHKAAARPAGAKTDLCIQGTTTCAAPWNWYAGFVSKPQKALLNRVVRPCVLGGLGGGGVTVTTNITLRLLLQGGVITVARFGSLFAGPAGIALSAVSGCVVSTASWGVSKVKALVTRLNPLKKGRG